MSRKILADNHARTIVPASESVSGLSLAFVLIGLMLTLPMFVLGAEVLSGLGAKRGSAAIVIAGILVAALASVTGVIGARTRLSTYSIIIAPFGVLGAKILTALLALVAVGWFGVTVGFFGEAVDVAMRDIAGVMLPPWVYGLGGGVLMTATVLFGFNGISLLNRIAVPMLALVLIWSGFSLLDQFSLREIWTADGRPEGTIRSVGLGVSAVVGLLAAAAGGMPDLTRFARSGRAVVTACLLSFASLSMGFAILAGAPGLVTGSSDFTANLIAIGLGAPALATLILATWTTNIVNLYAASLSLGRLIENRPDWILTLGAGAAGVAFALAGATQVFIGVLLTISALVPPIAGVYVSHYFLAGAAPDASAKRVRLTAAAAWALGGGAGLTTTFSGLSLTTVPAIDALAIAAIGYSALTIVSGAPFERK
jgi:cytosine permease